MRPFQWFRTARAAPQPIGIRLYFNLFATLKRAPGLHYQQPVSVTPGTPILIVDDDRQIRRLLESVAKRAGFDVETARDGQEALEMIDQKHYAIAIVDLMMPRVSGYELVQQISTRSPRPVVLVATAMTNSDVAELDDSMVRRVIRKPFDIEAVAQALVETAASIAATQEAAGEVIAASPPIISIPVPIASQPLAAEMGEPEEDNSAVAEPPAHTARADQRLVRGQALVPLAQPEIHAEQGPDLPFRIFQVHRPA